MSNPAQGAVGAETMTAGLTLTFDPSKLFDAVAQVGDGGAHLGSRLVGIMLSGARSTFLEDLGLAFYGVTAAPSLASPRADSDERTAFRPGDLVRNARYDHRDAYPALGESAYVQAVDGDYLDFGQGSKLLYSLFDLATPAQPAGAVPDSLREAFAAATDSPVFVHDFADPAVSSAPGCQDVSLSFVTPDHITAAFMGNGLAGTIDQARKDAVALAAAWNHVRALLASHPAGQSAATETDNFSFDQITAIGQYYHNEDGSIGYAGPPMTFKLGTHPAGQSAGSGASEYQHPGWKTYQQHGVLRTPGSTRTGQGEVERIKRLTEERDERAGAAALNLSVLKQWRKRAEVAEAALAARPAAPEAQGAWSFDMEAAPRDGRPVDLWVYFSEHGKERRVADAKWIDGDWFFGEFWRQQYLHMPEVRAWCLPAPPASSGQGGR